MIISLLLPFLSNIPWVVYLIFSAIDHPHHCGSFLFGPCHLELILGMTSLICLQKFKYLSKCWLTKFDYFWGLTNIKCHEECKRCIKKVKKSGKVGFSHNCPYDAALPTLGQCMDMSILFSQFDSSETELWKVGGILRQITEK